MFQPERVIRSPTERWERLVSIYIIIREKRAAAFIRMRKLRKERAEHVPKDEFQRRVESALFQGQAWAPIGCTCEQLRAHVEIHFTGNMGWHNDKDWHVDYLMPRCAFAPDDRLRAFHYSNLRPKRGPFGPIYTAPPLGDDPRTRRQERGVPPAVPNRIQAQAKRRATGEAEGIAAKICKKEATSTRLDQEGSTAGERQGRCQ